ncbi:hypothetical protein DFH11DRAFT_690966 [Phellopilus nigrolimitatus]|nr:hypothetical protein DFH11DRAFT_690966 [Phellopilus nigrolimitatus]
MFGRRPPTISGRVQLSYSSRCVRYDRNEGTWLPVVAHMKVSMGAPLQFKKHETAYTTSMACAGLVPSVAFSNSLYCSETREIIESEIIDIKAQNVFIPRLTPAADFFPLQTTYKMQTGTVELNNYLQSKKCLTALCWEERSSGPQHSPEWTCDCKINGSSYGTGKGPTKQDARNEAAKVALKAIEEEDMTQAS